MSTALKKPALPQSDDGGASFRSVMAALPTGVAVIAAKTESGPVAMVVGTLTAVSLEPRLIGFLPMRSSKSWSAIAPQGGFVASVLAGDQLDIVRTLTSRSSDKASRINWAETPGGGLAVRGALAWVEAEVEDIHVAGDHDIVVARVLSASAARPGLPLVFYQRGYHHTLPVHTFALDGWD